MKKYTKAQVMEAVRKSAGVMSTVAATMKCDWNTARKYVERDPEAVREFDVQKSRMVSMATGAMLRAVQTGERWAVERVMDTRGRGDGLGLTSHQQIDHTTGGDKIDRVQVEFIKPK